MVRFAKRGWAVLFIAGASACGPGVSTGPTHGVAAIPAAMAAEPAPAPVVLGPAVPDFSEPDPIPETDPSASSAYGGGVFTPAQPRAIAALDALLALDLCDGETCMTPFPVWEIRAVVAEDDRILALGPGNVLSTWDGAQWTIARLPVEVPMFGLSTDFRGTLWAVGAWRTILRRRGDAPWQLLDQIPEPDRDEENTLLDVAAVPPVGEQRGIVYVAGRARSYRWDRGQLEVLSGSAERVIADRHGATFVHPYGDSIIDLAGERAGAWSVAQCLAAGAASGCGPWIFLDDDADSDLTAEEVCRQLGGGEPERLPLRTVAELAAQAPALPVSRWAQQPPDGLRLAAVAGTSRAYVGLASGSWVLWTVDRSEAARAGADHGLSITPLREGARPAPVAVAVDGTTSWVLFPDRLVSVRDGQASVVALGSSTPLRAIASLGPDHLVVANSAGEIWRVRAGTVALIATLPIRPSAIGGVEGALVVGGESGELFLERGAEWSRVQTGTDVPITAVSDDGRVLGGALGTVLLRGPDDAITQLSRRSLATITAVRRDGASVRALAAGADLVEWTLDASGRELEGRRRAAVWLPLAFDAERVVYARASRDFYGRAAVIGPGSMPWTSTTMAASTPIAAERGSVAQADSVLPSSWLVPARAAERIAPHVPVAFRDIEHRPDLTWEGGQTCCSVESDEDGWNLVDAEYCTREDCVVESSVPLLGIDRRRGRALGLRVEGDRLVAEIRRLADGGLVARSPSSASPRAAWSFVEARGAQFQPLSSFTPQLRPDDELPFQPLMLLRRTSAADEIVVIEGDNRTARVLWSAPSAGGATGWYTITIGAGDDERWVHAQVGERALYLHVGPEVSESAGY